MTTVCHVLIFILLVFDHLMLILKEKPLKSQKISQTYISNTVGTALSKTIPTVQTFFLIILVSNLHNIQYIFINNIRTRKIFLYKLIVLNIQGKVVVICNSDCILVD